MKFNQFISEEYFTTLKIKGETGEIFKNPNSSEIRELRDANQYDELRGWLDPVSQNIWMWAAVSLEHGDVLIHSGFKRTFIPFYYTPSIKKVALSMYSLYPDTYNIYDAKIDKWLHDQLKNNVHIKRIMI